MRLLLQMLRLTLLKKKGDLKVALFLPIHTTTVLSGRDKSGRANHMQTASFYRAAKARMPWVAC